VTAGVECPSHLQHVFPHGGRHRGGYSVAMTADLPSRMAETNNGVCADAGFAGVIGVAGFARRPLG
jgi:hypothetical protein